MSPSMIKTALCVLTLTLSMLGGYWLRGVLDENKQLSSYLTKAGEAFILQGQVYEANKQLVVLEEEAKGLRKRKFDKAVVNYVQTISTSKCLSSPEFVQLYNSTLQTAGPPK